jgi:hypothetical protein
MKSNIQYSPEYLQQRSEQYLRETKIFSDQLTNIIENALPVAARREDGVLIYIYDDQTQKLIENIEKQRKEYIESNFSDVIHLINR